MKKVDAYLCGYYGMENSGDDALLYATAWGVRKYLQAESVTVSSSQSHQLTGFGGTPPSQSTRQRFRGHRRLQQYRAAFNSSCVVFGGGSVFHTAQDISIKRHLLRLSRGSNHYAMGVGLGPFKNTAAEKACAKFLNESRFTGLRDPASYELAKSIAPRANLMLTFDLAPLLLAQTVRPLREVPRAGIAVSLCPIFEAQGEVQQTALLKDLADSLRTIYQTTGEVIYLLDFNGHSSFGDVKIHQTLKAMLGDAIPVRHIPYEPDPIAVLQRMHQFKLVVGMRLHASILAYLAGTPTVVLEYHSKCRGWGEQIGLSERYRFATNEFDGSLFKAQVLAGLENSFSMPKLSVRRAISLSEGNWSNEYVSKKSEIYSGHSSLQQVSAYN